jgi:hypothetical protein
LRSPCDIRSEFVDLLEPSVGIDVLLQQSACKISLAETFLDVIVIAVEPQVQQPIIFLDELLAEGGCAEQATRSPSASAHLRPVQECSRL